VPGVSQQPAQPAREAIRVPESFSQASTYPRRLAWAGLNRELSRTAVHRLTSQGAELAPRQLGSAGGRERRHACQAAGGRASAAQPSTAGRSAAAATITAAGQSGSRHQDRCTEILPGP
jgi:hypothetical protein